MEVDGDVLSLQQLSEGLCTSNLTVKLDRIIFMEVDRYPLGPSRPMKECVGLQLVVFYDSMYRMVVSLDELPVIQHFASKLGEGRCYRISNFKVVRNREGHMKKYRIILIPTSQLERCASDLPEHCFNLVTIGNLYNRVSRPGCLVDVCGLVKTMYEPGLSPSMGHFAQEVVLVLYDNQGVLGSSNKTLTYSLHGVCAETTIRSYEAVKVDYPIFVVIQYALETGIINGVPILSSYHNATRFFSIQPSLPCWNKRCKWLQIITLSPHAKASPLFRISSFKKISISEFCGLILSLLEVNCCYHVSFLLDMLSACDRHYR